MRFNRKEKAMSSWMILGVVIVAIVFLFRTMGKGGGCCGGHQKKMDHKKESGNQRDVH